MKAHRVAVLLTLFLPAGLVHAHQGAYQGPYIGFGLGAAQHDITVENWDDDSLSSGSVDDVDISGNFYWGWRFSRHFSTELFYASLGETSVRGVSDGAGDIWCEGEILGVAKSNAFGFSTTANLPLGPWLNAFVKGGLFRWHVRQTDFDSCGRFHASQGGSDLMYGAGISLDITDQASLRLEWQRFNDVYNVYDIDMATLGISHYF